MIIKKSESSRPKCIHNGKMANIWGFFCFLTKKIWGFFLYFSKKHLGILLFFNQKDLGI